MKKLLLGLGTLGLATMPIASVVSCSDSSKIEDELKSLNVAPLGVGTGQITQQSLKLKNIKGVASFWVGAASFDKAKAVAAEAITTQEKLKEVTGIDLPAVSKKILDTWKSIRTKLISKRKENKWNDELSTALENLFDAMVDIIPDDGTAGSGYTTNNINAINAAAAVIIKTAPQTASGPCIFDIPVPYGKNDVFQLVDKFKDAKQLLETIHYEVKIMWLSVSIASGLSNLSDQLDFSGLESTLPVS